jgi:BirA family biotin operon repressor/biotin-[acetyl-CoA-carboxylase] ligase
VYSTRAKILLALERAPRKMVSGATLAKQLGLTRASVWKHVKALRAEGFPIQTRKASGYALAQAYDLSLLRGEATHHLRFWKAHYQFSVRSTQEQAKYAAGQESPEGHLWLAEKQTAGRGRLDRRWDSGLGGLWFSLLLRPAIAPSRVPSLTLIAALVLAEAIERETGLPARLKWPNDVVVKTAKGWLKVAGLLTEMSAEVDRTRWVVLGIGLNVNNRLPASLASQATSLGTLARKTFSRAVLLHGFLDAFGRTYRRFEKAGFEAFKSSYWQRYSRPNEPVRLKTAKGMVRGIARGVDARGALLVESQQHTQSIWEGEIVL